MNFSKFLLVSIFMFCNVAFANYNPVSEGFSAGTKVLTPNGVRLIEDLKKGDAVTSLYNENDKIEKCEDNTCKVESPLTLDREQKIINVISYESKNLYEIDVNGDFMRVDGAVQIFTINRGWLSAEKLTTQDVIINSDKTIGQVDSIRRANSPEMVYQIEVEGSHTYFASNILVHNGPATAALCGLVCKIISDAGCGFTAMALAAPMPPVAVLLGIVCAALTDIGSVPACIAICLGTPTP